MDVIVALRMVLALACVLGLLWFIGRRTGLRGPAAHRAPAMTLVGRQSLGGRSAVALVEVAGRRLVLGVGEHGVTLLTEVAMPTPDAGDRVALDTAELERLLALPAADGHATATATDATVGKTAGQTTEQVAEAPADHAVDAARLAAPLNFRDDVPVTTHSSPPAARKPAVPTPRNPLEGSILDATTWRRAVEAVQERTIRH